MLSYLYFIKVRLLVSLAYRFEAIFNVIAQVIMICVNYFFWTAIYGGTGSDMVVADTSLNDMLIYSVVAVLLSSLFSTSVENQMRGRIRQGNVAIDYIKPLSIFGMYFAQDIGEIVKNLLMSFFPLAIFSSIFIIVPLPYSATHFLLFFLSGILSFIILWLLAAIFALLYFWLIDLGPLGLVKDYLIRFLSGSIIPVWFFPQKIQNILAYMPFVYIYQYPISIFLGKINVSDAFHIIGLQLVWCVLLFIIFQLINMRASKHIMVQGG